MKCHAWKNCVLEFLEFIKRKTNRRRTRSDGGIESVFFDFDSGKREEEERKGKLFPGAEDEEK